MKIDEGYIKFTCQRDHSELDLPNNFLVDLNIWRSKLKENNLIGETPEGIGFGNISLRSEEQFYITGSATGGITLLGSEHIALVTNWNYSKNTLNCTGFIDASSESLSHAAVYEANSTCKAVIHVHHKRMWNKFLNKMATTPASAKFGTPELALAIHKIISTNKHVDNILFTAGHEDGVIAWGESLQDVYNVLQKYLEK
ncbi:class II aldolase/adducin family protein [Puteibacter caeruleilacunae]|nr:class II aldolase/adducin family protein [Puteibacter caeruleilacunae]